MIFEALLAVLYTVTSTVFGVLPDLPPMPAQIVTAAEWLLGITEYGLGLISMILGPVLFTAGIAALIVLWQFERVYHLALYVIKRIRG